MVFIYQRIVRMNKTEDDELEAEALTDEEIKQVAGDYQNMGYLSLAIWLSH